MPPAEDVQDQPAKAPFSWAKLVKPASVAVVNPTIGTAPNTTKNVCRQSLTWFENMRKVFACQM